MGTDMAVILGEVMVSGRVMMVPKVARICDACVYTGTCVNMIRLRAAEGRRAHDGGRGRRWRG
jgi:hypothetical protein